MPPSCVKKPSISRPDAISVGGVPSFHFIPDHHVIAEEPPLVKSRTKEPTLGVTGTFDTVKAVAPEIVFVKYVPVFIVEKNEYLTPKI